MILQLVKSIITMIEQPAFNKDCISYGQLRSKEWLISEVTKLNLNLGTVFLCAGWYATLSIMLFESSNQITKIRSFDVDLSCCDIAETFNKPWVIDNWKFKACTADILKMTYPTTYTVTRANGSTVELQDMPNTIINTSCEHIDNFTNWFNNIPLDTIVILQSNNYSSIAEHINCSNNLDHFKELTPLSTELYSGELVLPKYTRYMRIGIK